MPLLWGLSLVRGLLASMGQAQVFYHRVLLPLLRVLEVLDLSPPPHLNPTPCLVSRMDIIPFCSPQFIPSGDVASVDDTSERGEPAGMQIAYTATSQD